MAFLTAIQFAQFNSRRQVRETQVVAKSFGLREFDRAPMVSRSEKIAFQKRVSQPRPSRDGFGTRTRRGAVATRTPGVGTFDADDAVCASVFRIRVSAHG